MASIQKRKNKNGTSHWRAVVRIKGYPTVCNHFDRKQEAEDWATDVERQIKQGKFNFDQHKKQHTFVQLFDCVQKSTKSLKTLHGDILEELRIMIQQAREYVATTINSSLTLLYWHVGRRIQKEILKGERAEYGRSIVISLSQQLVREYGNGFNSKNLHRMIQLAEIFPEEQIVVSLTRQLSWTHFVVLIPIQDTLKRDFYAEMCRIEKWNVRTLCNRIDSMLFERTAISRKPELVVQAEIDALRKEDRREAQEVIRRHYNWLPWNGSSCTKEAYIGLGQGYTGFEWQEAFTPYDPDHPKLARFLAEGMKVFAERELA